MIFHFVFTISFVLSGYRVPRQLQQAVEFTSLLTAPKEREVFNVRVQGENQVIAFILLPSLISLTEDQSQPVPDLLTCC